MRCVMLLYLHSLVAVVAVHVTIVATITLFTGRTCHIVSYCPSVQRLQL